MSLLSEIGAYARFSWGLWGYLGHSITLEEARGIVQRRLEEREARFLRLVRRNIYDHPGSPYLPLLKMAQVDLSDLEHMVGAQGLEPTLRALREAGVYVTFEEFKGREPLVRDGREMPVRAQDFDNPYLKYTYSGETGGSTGAGMRVEMDLEHHTELAPSIMLAHAAHGVLHVPTAIWFGLLPESTGFNKILRQAPFRQIPEKWFSPVKPGEVRPSLKSRLATYHIIATSRLRGVWIPVPEPVPLDRALVLARWAGATLQTHDRCLIRTGVSRALRISLAARKAGLDLTGTTFLGGGEPPTPAKVREIARSGARLVPNYWMTEAGLIGMGCARPVDGNDLHYIKDIVALVQFPRKVPGSEIMVDAFHVTTLLPAVPKVMLNVESDDYGVMEQRPCGCPLEDLGFTEHLRHIRSFRKLTGEGVTLVGSEMIRILEETLPARFGGSPLDYQLLEEEDEQGFTRLSIIVSPRVEISDDAEVVATVLAALGQGSGAADVAQVHWRQAGTLRVKRMEPIWTGRAKLMPLHIASRGKNAGSGP